MPKPLYIICSQSGSIDRRTGWISLFNVVDSMIFSEVSADGSEAHQPKGDLVTQFRATAVWKAEEGDRDSEFEFQCVIIAPHTKEEDVGSGTFKFTGSRHRLVHAINIERGQIASAIQVQSGDEVIVESRVRRVGDSDWVSQKYPIEIKVLTGSPATS